MGGPLKTMLTKEDTRPNTEVILGRINMVGVGGPASSLIMGHHILSSEEEVVRKDLHHLNSLSTHPLQSTIATKS